MKIGLIGIGKIANYQMQAISHTKGISLVDAHGSAQHHQSVIGAHVWPGFGLAAEIHVANTESRGFQLWIQGAQGFVGDVLKYQYSLHFSGMPGNERRREFYIFRRTRPERTEKWGLTHVRRPAYTRALLIETG